MSEVSHFTDLPGESRRTSIEDGIGVELDQDVTEFVDFKPLYKCVHINSLLGQRDQFIFQYRNEREEQAAILFKLPKSELNSGSVLQIFREFITQILGFFAVEDLVHHSTGSTDDDRKCGRGPLVDKMWLERLLLTAVSRIVMLIRIQQSHECKELQELKKLTLSFCKSLEAFGFYEGVEDIRAVLPDIFKQFNQGLLNLYGDLFTTSIRYYII